MLLGSQQAVAAALQQARRYASAQSVRRIAVCDGSLHPKYHLPARCFGYVGNPADPRTWKLPYLLADGRPDPRRLPKAVQALLTNYRGAVASTVPEDAVIDTLVRLGGAVGMLGKMPGQCAEPAAVYVELAAALDQAGRLVELGLVRA